MPVDDDAAAAAATGQQPTEEFKLLDIEGAPPPSHSYRSTAQAISAADGDTPLADKLSRLAFTGINALFACGTIAVVKQMVNPANYSPSESAAAQEASKTLPSWFAGQYKQRRVASAMTHRVVRDTGVLMGASGMWYGVQFALRKLRGEHDAFNVCVAGTLSAGFLGATFIDPLKWSRAGLWGAVGGLLGYYGFREQQAMRALLLERQQELEQKHMGVAVEKVHAKLDPKLLKELLQLEQRERQEQLRAQMQKHGVQVPATGGAQENGSSSGSSSTEAGSSGGSGPWSGGDTAADRDDQWRSLLNAAPWLQDDDSDSHTQ